MKPKNFRLSHIARRFLIQIIPVSVAGIVVLGVSAYLVLKPYIIKNVEKEIDILSRESAQNISAFLTQIENDLEIISENPLLTDYYKNIDYDLLEEAEQYRQEIEQYFLRFAKRRKVYSEVLYINNQKKKVAHVKDGLLKKSKTGPHLKKILKETSCLKNGSIYKEIQKTKPPGYAVMLSAKPLFDDYGSFKGTILLKASLANIQKTLTNLSLGDRGIAFFTTADEKPILVASQSVIDPKNWPDYISAKSEIENTAYKLIIYANINDFLASLLVIRKYSVIFALLSSVLVAIFIYFMVNNITRPINSLVDATKDLAKGRDYTPVTVYTNDEIGTLSKSFNIMAKDLTTRTNELEYRVRELLSLQQMSSAITQQLDKEDIYKVCLDMAVKGLDFERGTLYIVDEEKNCIRGGYVCGMESVGFTQEQMQKRRVPFGSNNILIECMRKREVMNIADPINDPRCSEYAKDTKSRGFCLAPIMTKERVYAMIAASNFHSKRPITQAQTDTLQLFCNAAGLALENSELISNIRKSEERYRIILDSSTEAIVGLDSKLDITVWNRGAEKIFQVSSEKAKGTAFAQFFDEGTLAKITKSLQNKKSFEGYSVLAKTHKGRKLELNINWTVAGREEQSKEWAVVINDVTEIKKLQSQLIQAEKLSAVGQLISTVAHELNNPLTVIVGFAELLENKSKNSKQKMPCEINYINESAKRCQSIISNLLSFVRTSKDRREPVNINKTIDTALTLLYPKMSRSGKISLSKKTDKNIPEISGDYHQIEQVLVNIIRNSCDALATNTGEKKIDISAYCKHNDVFIKLSNNGPAIPPEILPDIFEPFVTTKKEGEGTGLGLSICKRIIESHRGDISVSSNPDVTTFTIKFPALKKEKKALLGIVKKHRKLATSKKILVIDDEKDVLSLIEKILIRHNQSVDIATSGEKALEKIRKTNYDIILCDIEMSGMDGFEVYENIAGVLPKPRFVFMTGKVIDKALERRFESLKIPCLNKPFSINDLLSVI